MITLPNNHQDDFAEPAVVGDELLCATSRLHLVSIHGRKVESPAQRICFAPTPAPLVEATTLLKWLKMRKNREISAMNWADRCSLILYDSEHPHGGCRFPEPSLLLPITGVQPRKLRVKDWQNAHGKVSIVSSGLDPRKGGKIYS